MKIWWSATSIAQYTKYRDDAMVLATFDDLLKFIAERPNRGYRLDELAKLSDRESQRVVAALCAMDLDHAARVVIATVPPPPRPMPPPVRAVAVHTRSVPKGVNADHSLLVLGILPRQSDELR